MASTNQSSNSGNIIYLHDISVDVFNILYFFFNCVFIQTICFFGIVGNILTIVILFNNGLKSSTNIALLTLAVSDLLFSITESFSKIIYPIQYFDNDLSQAMYSYFVVYVYVWNQYSTQLSIDLVMVIAVERMIAVWFPFKVSQLMSPFRMGCIVVSVVILLVPLYLPYAFYLSLVQVSDGNKTIIYVQESQYVVENAISYEILRKYVVVVFNAIIPSATIIICSMLIIYKLTLSSRKVKKMSSDASEKRVKDLKSIKITLCLCLFVVVLVLVPSNTMDIYFTYTADKLYSGRIKLLLTWVAQSIYQINASINFIIYVIFNSKFSKTFKKLYTCSNTSK